MAIEHIDYDTHPHFQRDQPFGADYGSTIVRLQQAFNKDIEDKESLLKEARAAMEKYTLEGLKKEFGLKSHYSLAKELYTDCIFCNAGAVARILTTTNREKEAVDFIFGLYDQLRELGFNRGFSFLPNRLDSRTFMPMRRLMDESYMDKIGFTKRDRIFLAVGDCQTMLLAEKIRDQASLPSFDIIAYQHNLGSMVGSGLTKLFKTKGYFHFVNAAANYAIFPGANKERRDSVLAEMQYLVDYVNEQDVDIAVFVTHVFFGAAQSVKCNKTRWEDVMDSLSVFSDEVAAILSKAKNARCINLRDVCPLVIDNGPFRDGEDGINQLHFKFHYYDKIMALINKELESVS